MHLLIAYLLGFVLTFLAMRLVALSVTPAAGLVLITALAVPIGLIDLGPSITVVLVAGLWAAYRWVPGFGAAIGVVWSVLFGLLIVGLFTAFTVPTVIGVIAGLAAAAAVLHATFTAPAVV